MRLVVVGHVEHADFLEVDRLPVAGEIVHAGGGREGAGGGGAVAARVLQSLAGGCTFVTALGDDWRGRADGDELRALGIDVRAQVVARPQRRVVTFLTPGGERTIVVAGERLVPQGGAPLGDADGVYFTGGDAAAARAARAARVLVATPRARDALLEAGVRPDALVGSAGDPGEPMEGLPAHWVVRTRGAAGGAWQAADGTSGTWDAAPLPGAVCDAYGCGDGFAAALTAGLAEHGDIAAACALGARVGAAVLCTPAPSVHV